MKGKCPYYIVFIWTLITIFVPLHAQFDVTTSNNTLDPETIVKTIFLGDGVDVVSVNYLGSTQAIGYFNNAEEEVGIERGIILSTGRVSSANSPASVLADGMLSNTPVSDPDLEKLITGDYMLYDRASIEITFIPVSDTLRFKYAFASEEYPEFICSNFNDVFGFFISGPNPAGGNYVGQNIALIPDPADPSGNTFTTDFVSINNIHPATNKCAASYETYYNENTSSTHLVYGAYINTFTAQALVTPCQPYTIRLAISDVGDNRLDSGVFLEAKSFGTDQVGVDIQTISLDGSIAEGCDPGQLIFSIPKKLDKDYELELKFVDCGNSATNNIDFTGLPEKIEFPAGKDSVLIELYALEDGIDEGVEYICFEIQRDPCNLDTVRIPIRESIIQAPELPNNQELCLGKEVLLKATLPDDFKVPEPIVFENSSNIDIDKDAPNVSEIEVSGMDFDILAPGMIKSICIDRLKSRYLNDYDIFLQTPGGQFLELSTDNGDKPNNGQDMDSLVNTCFVPTATVNINNGNPTLGPIFPANPTYTGDFAPEGDWNDLYDGKGKVNGTYKLIVTADENPGKPSFFEGWKITFNPLYFLKYEWTDDKGTLICADCDSINVKPDVSTKYYLNLKDSYGCSIKDSFSVEILPSLDSVPDLVCDSISKDYIRWTWGAVTGATGYEVSINGGAFIDIGNSLEYGLGGLETGNAYSITVRATGGVCGGLPRTITCETQICGLKNINVEIVNVSCVGDSDGRITVTGDSDFIPLTYQLASNGTNNQTGVFDNLPIGSDSVLITDNIGCVTKIGFEVLEPKPIVLDFKFVVDVKCFNEMNGEALVFTEGGTPPFTFAWDSGETSETAKMLKAGHNVVTVTDSKGCVMIDSVLIKQPNLIILNDYLTNPATCDKNGNAFVSVKSGGLKPYTFAWNDSDNKTTQQVTLPKGTYIVTVSDANNCSVTQEVVIDGPPDISLNVTGTDVPCSEGFGTGTATYSGGTGNIAVLWTPSNENTDMATKLKVGWNYVKVTDEAGCSAIDSVFIKSASAINISISEKPVTCFGGNDGSITFTISGDHPPFEINYNGANINGVEHNDLKAQEYCYTIKDANNCSKDTCYTVSQPEDIKIDVNKKPETCAGLKNGSIDITINGGASPFDYNWTGPNGFMASTEDIENLSSGSYSYTVTDANKCEKTGVVILTEPGSVKLSSTTINIACKGDKTGSINITVEGAKPPLVFSWTGPNGFTSNQQDIAGLEAGEYTLEFSEGSDCMITKTFTIIEPALALTTGISPNDSICFGAKNGIASVAPSGGTPPYSVLWSNNSGLSNLNGLSAGTYTVTITDGSNCTATDAVEIVELKEIVLTLGQSGASCFDSEDGSASLINAAYGNIQIPLDSLKLIWNSFPIQNTIQANGLKGGATYTLVATDKLGCSAAASITIDNPAPINITLDGIDEISCADGDNGAISVSAGGGTDPYSFKWDVNANTQITSKATNLKRGKYTVTVSDANNCTNEATFELIDPLPITLSYRVFDVLCVGDSNGEIEAIPGGGKKPYQFIWENLSKSETLSDLKAGKYALTIIDANNCLIQDTVAVSEPVEPVQIDLELTNVSCHNSQDGRIKINARGGSGGYLYSTDNKVFNGVEEQIGLKKGVYSIYVKDKNGCIDSIAPVDIMAPDTFAVDLGPDVFIKYNTQHQLIANIKNGVPPFDWKWISDVSQYMTCVDCENPYYKGVKPGTVYLELIDKNGCVAKSLINIRIQDLNLAYVPTAFTPNGDFSNDKLSVFGIDGTKVLKFEVFDRWGEKLYSTNDIEINNRQQGWDGTFKGKPMNPGVYIWVVEVNSLLGSPEIYKGNTTLIR